MPWGLTEFAGRPASRREQTAAAGVDKACTTANVAPTCMAFLPGPNAGIVPSSDTEAVTASRARAGAASSADTPERVMEEGAAGWDTGHANAPDVGLHRLKFAHKTAC